jgi:hypothetical protein
MWILVPLAAVLELGHHAWVQSRVPREADWKRAEEVIERGHEEGDLVVIAPWWASQGWRWLGRFMTVQQMAREDDEGYGRIWEVSLPGHRHERYASSGRLVQEHPAGRLTVRLYSFPQAPATVYDFVAEIETGARVSMIPVSGGPEEPCTFTANPKSGIVPNAAVQTGKWRCDERLPWNYVAREVIPDLSNRPRLCLWAHPIDGKRIHIEYADVPEGEVIEGHVGRRYEADRESEGRPPVYLDVLVGGQMVGTAAHPEGGGWLPYRFDLGTHSSAEGVTFEVHSPQAGMAHFCFTAKLRNR